MKQIPVNELNQPLGEAHPRCRIPDAMVVRIRDLYERHKLTKREVARATGVSFWTVKDYVEYRRRRMVYSNWRAAKDEDDGE